MSDRQEELDIMTNDIFYQFYPPDEKLLQNSFLSIEFDQCISMGMNCNSASCLTESNNRHFKLPFDWMQASISNYRRMIQDMKNKNINCQVQLEPRVVLKHYDAWIPHEPNQNINEIEQNYIKYFNRLDKILDHDERNNKNICIVITSFDTLNKEIVQNYKELLNEMYPRNNYFFLTCNFGEDPFVTHDHINIVNKRIEGYHVEGKWIGNIYNKPLFHFFSTYVSSKK